MKTFFTLLLGVAYSVSKFTGKAVFICLIRLQGNKVLIAFFIRCHGEIQRFHAAIRRQEQVKRAAGASETCSKRVQDHFFKDRPRSGPCPAALLASVVAPGP